MTILTPSVKDNRQRLLDCQKSPVGAPLYSRLINRPLGRWAAAVGHRWGMTPNQMTGVSALFSAVGIALMQLPPTVASGVAIAVALIIGYALDSADGQLARLRGGGSAAGEWLDHVVDCLKIGCFHASVLISWYRHGTPGDGPWLLAPLGFMIAAQMYFFAYVLGDLLRRVAVARREAAVPQSGRSASWTRAALVAPTDYGIHCVLFVLWGWPWMFGCLYAGCAVAVAAYVMLGAPRWFHQMQALAQKG